MKKPVRKNRTTKQKLIRARTIVIACKRLARKKLQPEFIDLIAQHVLQTMPRHLANRLAKSLDAQAMKAAMELTRPYLA